MRALTGLLMLIICGSAWASIDVMPFNDEAQEQRFHQLTEQLRCPKCQNNSISDSSSMIATDLRQKVYNLLQEGKSNQEIVDYMVVRYGHFVTYDPPLNPLTLLLWGLPLAIVILGCWVIYTRAQRRVRLKQELFPDKTPSERKQSGLILYLPGICLALGIGILCYDQTGSYQQVKTLQQASARMPELLKRALSAQGKPLSQEERAYLILGLRTRLKSAPDNVEGWIMLGRLGVMEGDVAMAADAYANALRLEPLNRDARQSYFQ